MLQRSLQVSSKQTDVIRILVTLGTWQNTNGSDKLCMEIPSLEGQARSQNSSHSPGEFPSAQTQTGSTPKSFLDADNSNSALLLMNQDWHSAPCNQATKGDRQLWGKLRKAAQAHGNAHLVGALQRKDTVEGRDCWWRAGLGCVTE